MYSCDQCGYQYSMQRTVYAAWLEDKRLHRAAALIILILSTLLCALTLGPLGQRTKCGAEGKATWEGVGEERDREKRLVWERVVEEGELLGLAREGERGRVALLGL